MVIHTKVILNTYHIWLYHGFAGTPNDDLRSPPFAEFEPIRVLPTYPDWFIDTPGGIATLVILCLLTVIIIPLLILLCKKKQWLCFKAKLVSDNRLRDIAVL